MPVVTATSSRVPPGFERQEIRVNGADVVLFVGGTGDPLCSSMAEPSRIQLRGVVGAAVRSTPYHPGFGESADSAAITSIDDYVLHYLDLMDHLGLDKVRLVGLSLGGWIAARLAAQNSHRLTKLVLVGPAGLRVPEHPTTDIFRLRPEQVPQHLVHDLAVLAPHVPDPNTPEFLEFLVNDFHEMSSLARVIWERPYDPKLGRWLHRIAVPTLLLYGEHDQITPVQQAAAWAALIPKAKVQVVKEAGHLVLDEQAEARKAVLDFLA